MLRAYIRAGSVAAAAYELGISETTVRQHLLGLYRPGGSRRPLWLLAQRLVAGGDRRHPPHLYIVMVVLPWACPAAT